MQMLKADMYMGRVGVGVTSPSLIKADDGYIYVVKMKNNRLGTKVLVNEYIAAWMGKKLNLPFPFSDCIELSDEFISQNRRLHIKMKAGIHFASRYLKKTKYVHYYHMPYVINKPEFAGVILFDHFMLNEDRTLNGKNILISKVEAGYQMYAIDNSHLFGSGRWLTEKLPTLVHQFKLNKRRAFGSLLKHDLKKEDFTEYMNKIKLIKDEEIEEFICKIPEEWGMQEKDKAAIGHFIKCRRDIVEDITGKIIASIPNVHGSTEINELK